MAATSKELFEAALGLDPEERAHLAHELLASLEVEDEGVEEAWRDEIVRRAREVLEGRAVLVDGEASLREVRERLQRP
jgi:hypothetical protein